MAQAVGPRHDRRRHGDSELHAHRIEPKVAGQLLQLPMDRVAKVEDLKAAFLNPNGTRRKRYIPLEVMKAVFSISSSPSKATCQ